MFGDLAAEFVKAKFEGQIAGCGSAPNTRGPHLASPNAMYAALEHDCVGCAATSRGDELAICEV